MRSLRELHQQDGETGHFGEFFVALGAAILVGGVILLMWGLQAAPSNSGKAVGFDAVTSATLYIVGGLGVVTFGLYGILSGWGRHHPKYASGGDPDVEDIYDPEGQPL